MAEQPRKVGASERIKYKHCRADFDLGDILGEGAYARVNVGRVTNPESPYCGREYAVKVMEKKFMAKHDKVKYVMLEKKVFLLTEKHPFICRLHFSFQDDYSLFFVLDYAREGDLSYLIWKYMRLPVALARFYLSEIVSAVEFMHSVGVFHRDLKPDNVLIHADGHIRLTDFGTTKYVDPSDEAAVAEALRQQTMGTGTTSKTPPHDDDSSEPMATMDEFADSQTGAAERRGSFVGTAFYVPPELLANGPFSFAGMDFWAMGVILYQCLTGTVPFHGAMDYEVFKKIEALDFTIPDSVPEDAASLITQFLNADYTERLGSNGFDEIREHEFFDVEDWSHDAMAVRIAPEFPPVPLESPWIAQGGDDMGTRARKETTQEDEMYELQKAATVNMSATTMHELTSLSATTTTSAGGGGAVKSALSGGSSDGRKQSFDSELFARWKELLRADESIAFGSQVEVAKYFGFSSDSYVMLFTDKKRLLLCNHIEMTVVHAFALETVTNFQVTDKDWFTFKRGKKSWKIKVIGSTSYKWKEALGFD